MTARLDVTPKTTEQNQIVCTSKSEAEVTNNKKTVPKVKANYWQTRSIMLPLSIAELLVKTWIHLSNKNQQINLMNWFNIIQSHNRKNSEDSVIVSISNDYIVSINDYIVSINDYIVSISNDYIVSINDYIVSISNDYILLVMITLSVLMITLSVSVMITFMQISNCLSRLQNICRKQVYTSNQITA